jgi:hypothetical protein
MWSSVLPDHLHCILEPTEQVITKNSEKSDLYLAEHRNPQTMIERPFTGPYLALRWSTRPC